MHQMDARSLPLRHVLSTMGRLLSWYLAAGRGMGDVAFGLERGRTEYVRTGLNALALCIPVPDSLST